MKKPFICICEKVNGYITTTTTSGFGARGRGCVFALWDSFKLIIIIVTKSKLALIVPSQVKIQLLLIEDLMEMFLMLKLEIDIKMIQQKRNFNCYCEETKKVSFLN